MFLRVLCIALAIVSITSAQEVLNNDSVMKLTKAGMSESVIITMVGQQPGNYSVGVDDLIALKASGVADRVVAVMVSKASGAAAPAVAMSAPASSGTEKTMDVGIYAKRSDGTWGDVTPEVVNWKTGGTIKSMATYGIVKKDLNGNLAGATSKTEVDSPAELLIVTQEGVAVTEYQLIKLRPGKKDREFRTMTGGVFNQSSGATRDLVAFEGKKVASRTFSIALEKLTPGEYGFLAPGAFGSSGNTVAQIGKMYTFRVVE